MLYIQVAMHLWFSITWYVLHIIKLVIKDSRSTFFVRIDGNMFLLQRRSAIIRAVSNLPVRLDGLFHIPFQIVIPFFSFALHTLEISMGISLDQFLMFLTLFDLIFGGHVDYRGEIAKDRVGRITTEAMDGMVSALLFS